MRKIFTIVSTMIILGAFQASAQSAPPAAGNSSGGGGVSVDAPVVTSVEFLPPPDIHACLQQDDQGNKSVMIRWSGIGLERINAFDIYSCTDAGYQSLNGGFADYRKQVLKWEDDSRTARRQNLAAPTYPPMPDSLSQFRIGVVPSSSYVVPTDNPEDVHYEFHTPVPQDPNGKFCLMDEDGEYHFIDQLSKPVAIETCATPSEARSDLPAPQGMNACHYESDAGYNGPGSYNDEIEFKWPRIKDPSLVGYKVYTCDDSDFANGEPSLDTLKKNWVRTDELGFSAAESTYTLETYEIDGPVNDHTIMTKKYCLAAYDKNGAIGHLSKPIEAPQHLGDCTGN